MQAVQSTLLDANIQAQVPVQLGIKTRYIGVGANSPLRHELDSSSTLVSVRDSDLLGRAALAIQPCHFTIAS